MEEWQGLPTEVRRQYAVIRTLKRTAHKELVLLQNRQTGARVLLRNYPGELSGVYSILAGKTLPHLPRVYECGLRAGGYYVLEEFVEGHSLGAQCLSVQQTMCVLRQLCEALAALHALGIVHRDVKPDNVLSTESGEVCLIDFDAARQYKTHVEKDTCTLGTTGFAAPEQFGIVQTDHRADIFALGVTLNVLVTGCHPSQMLCRGPLRLRRRAVRRVRVPRPFLPAAGLAARRFARERRRRAAVRRGVRGEPDARERRVRQQRSLRAGV